MKSHEIAPRLVASALALVALAATLTLFAQTSHAAVYSRGYYGGGSYGGRTYTRSYGGHSYGGYYGGGIRYRSPYRYRYYYPRSSFSFGIHFGYPSYYYYPSYPYYYCPEPVVVAPRHVYVEPDRRYEERRVEIDVTNEPPAGCYYYDPFCGQRFSNLDDYTDHLQNQDHAQTIEIIDRDSGDQVRMLEFVDGVWRVRQ